MKGQKTRVAPGEYIYLGRDRGKEKITSVHYSGTGTRNGEVVKFIDVNTTGGGPYRFTEEGYMEVTCGDLNQAADGQREGGE